ncbi:MAG TPA: hypothetical protein VLY85_03470 [Thermoplasmata archaeon]|nr:hypothetical protein [Thermoplasmata archaeon]HUI38672.1 hypothetical protein [Thermoplasmata archaeon]
MAQSGMTPGAPLPPPPQWNPTPAPTTITIPWNSLMMWGRAIGFLLIFVGTLIVIAFASIPGSCITTPSSCSSFPSQFANSIWAGKILWVLGLFFIGGASGIRLQRRFSGNTNEDGAGAVARLRANVLIVVLSILLMALILFTVNGSPAVAIP